jgi:hypothetical protein
VVNHGHSYYFSSLELQLYLALLRTEPKPDAVIFLDGLNDAIHLLRGFDEPFYSDIARSAWERELERRGFMAARGPWFKVTQAWPVFRLTRRMRSLFKDDPPPLFLPAAMAPADPVEHALSHFRTNRRILFAVGRANGIPTFQFLQPIPGYGPCRAPMSELTPDVKRLYDALLKEGSLVRLHESLRSVEKPYLDKFHYSDAASLVLAAKMAAFLIPRLKER